MAGLTLAPGERDPRRISDAVRQLAEGRSNAVGTVTLTPNAAATTVSAPTAAPGSLVYLTPQTANAAAALATTYIQPANISFGQFIVTHANNAQADKTFGWEIRG